MPLLQRILFLLSGLAILVSGFGYDPLALLIPGVAPYTLPSLLVVACLFMQFASSRHLAEAVKQTRAHCETMQDEWRIAAARLDNAEVTVTQLSEAVHAMQQTVAEQEALLPGKFLLFQQRYDDAVKILQQAVEHQPDSVEARWLLGEALLGTRRYVEALPHLHAGLIVDDAHRLALVAQCEQALGHYPEAEARLLQLIEVRGEVRQDDLVALGVVQSELEPSRATETLSQALELNPYNSAARYQLMDLMMHTGDHERAIELATEGLRRNPADTGCYVSRAEAYFRRGHVEDEKDILQDLMLAQAKNRKDYNIYRLRGALHQRQASRASSLAERRRTLRQTMETYEDGLANVPVKFHAHLLAAESRVLLQLKRFDEAAKTAQRAVEHHASHVSNHLALALARLAAKQWQPAIQASDRGMQWAGWGGRIWLTAIAIFAHACAGVEPTALRQKCTTLAGELKADSRHFALSETWIIVRDVLQEAVSEAADACRTLVHDTITLLEQNTTPEQYQRTWGDGQDSSHEVT